MEEEWKIRGHVLELTRMRDAIDKMDRARARAMARARARDGERYSFMHPERRNKENSRNERARRGHGCLTSPRNETKRGNWATEETVAPDAGHLIADAIFTRQVLY